MPEPYWVQVGRARMQRLDEQIGGAIFADTRADIRRRRAAIGDRIAAWERGEAVGGWPVEAGSEKGRAAEGGKQ